MVSALFLYFNRIAKTLSFCLLSTFVSQTVYSQVSVSFLAPDTVCVDAPISIINQSTGGTTNFWSFCAGNLNSIPNATNLGNLGGNLDLPVFMDYAYSNGNYYGFVVNHRAGYLTRLNFGNSLLNNPTTTIISIPPAVLPAMDGAEDIQIIQNEGKWYAIMLAGYPPTGYSPRIIKIEFGTNIENLNPVATNWGNIGNLLQPIGFHMFQDGINWYGFTVNAENNTITRFNFTNSFDNTPTAVNLGNVGNLAYPTSIYAINNNGNWLAFVLNAGNNTTTSGNFSISRLDFGNSLLNIPTGVNIGNPNGVLRHPRDFTILKSCGETVGFAVNGMPGTYDLVKLDFNNDLTSVPSGSSFGNIGGFNFPHSISKIFRTGENLYSFVTNVLDNSVSRIEFSGCNNSSIPSSTQFSPPSFSYNSPGNYTVSLLVDEGLSTQTAFCKTITVVAPPAAILSADTSLCELGTVELRALEQNGIQYQWSNGGTGSVTSVTSDGKFWLDMVTRTGCQATDTIEVVMAPSPIFSFGADTSICRDARFTLSSPQVADHYTWQDGSSLPAIEISQTGTYFLTLQNGDCTFTDTLQVLALPDPVIDLGIDPVICPDQTLNLIPDIQSYPIYTWSDGSTASNISVNTPGLYWVEATNTDGCSFRDSVQVNLANPLTVDLGADQELCEPASITLSAPTGGDQYLWSTGATGPILTLTQSGTYYVDISKEGCTYSDTVLVILKPRPTLTVSPNTSICANEVLELNAISNASIINWSTGETGSLIRITEAGTYSVEVDLDGCSSQETINVTPELPPAISLGDDVAICEGQAVQIVVEVSNGNFLNWSDGSILEQRTITNTGQYIAWAENRCGISSDTLMVRPGSDKENSYQLPNAFTPNGDGKNDCFGIQNWLIRDLKEFSIYNRFGQLIFSGNNSNKCWNGVFNGTLQENGGYVYVLRAETYCGTINKKGIFLLVK